MTESSQPPSSSATTPSVNACLDPLDLDAFINYDQVRCPSPSISPVAGRSQMAARPTSATANPNNTLLPPSQRAGSNVQQTFSGPSHQYDLHKQQTGLPLGAIANTLAVNQRLGSLARANSDYSMTNDGLLGSTTDEELFDFSSMPSHNPSVSVASDVDMEFDSPHGESLPAFFFPEANGASSSDFVDPNSLNGQGLVEQPLSTPNSAPGGNAPRAWPGMHQHNAAKVQEQKQRQAAAQQQRSRQQIASSQRLKASSQHERDPIVEERISRLLSSMRQSSVAGSEDGQHPDVLPHVHRIKKDEEDMDDDERLLASEEGKKLSSKERRQLRNKVSARAFRSRRKEYIGQLEAEVAAKSNEASDLKIQNRALMEENTRLSDLTRMLLSSPAFSNFLDALGDSASTSTTSDPQAAGSGVAESRKAMTTARKDPNPVTVVQQAQSSQQNDAHIGMTFVPESPLDLSMLRLNGNNGWGTGAADASSWPSHQPRVFTVTDVPLGPAVDQIDTNALCGKSTNFIESFCSSESKPELPTVQPMPSMTAEKVTESSKVQCSEELQPEEGDADLALYADAPVESSKSRCCPNDEAFGLSEKSFPQYDLVLSSECENHRVLEETIAVDRFHRMCSSVEAACQRLERLTAHL